jgi:hypothetical protein
LCYRRNIHIFLKVSFVVFVYIGHIMDEDYKSRLGMSYGSARRRIRQSVANAMQVLAGNTCDPTITDEVGSETEQ